MQSTWKGRENPPTTVSLKQVRTSCILESVCKNIYTIRSKKSHKLSLSTKKFCSGFVGLSMFGAEVNIHN